MTDVSVGTVLWSSIAFLVVLFILAKFAWKPILAAIREREESIDEALKSVQTARTEMQNLQASNEELLRQARLERDLMLKEARDAKERIISESKQRAEDEYTRILNSAREAIQTEKMAAITEIKTEIATLSIDIAEKLLRAELQSETKQKALIEKYLEEAKIN
jgi:F-type H+-transporting ATPase subunit b